MRGHTCAGSVGLPRHDHRPLRDETQPQSSHPSLEGDKRYGHYSHVAVVQSLEANRGGAVSMHYYMYSSHHQTVVSSIAYKRFTSEHETSM